MAVIRAKWFAGIGALTLGLGLAALMAAPAAAATAPPRLQMNFDWSQNGSVITFETSIQESQAYLHPLFQFWTNDGHGWKMVQNYSTQWSYQLPASKTPVLVMVFGLTRAQWQARDYKAAVSAARWDVANANVLLTTPISPQAETSYGLTASSTSVPNPVYQLWTQDPNGTWVSSGPNQSSPKFLWKPQNNGLYHFVIYARDSLLPAYAGDEVSSTAGVTTADTANAVLFESALPYVPIGGMKTVTATVVNAIQHVDPAYSGPVTILVKSGGAFTVKGSGGPVSNGTVTADAKDGVAVFTITGGSAIGATGSVAATFPYRAQPITLTDVSNSTAAQVGYGFFTSSGQRISSGHPLLTAAGIPYEQSPLIPVTLKPVNVYGNAVPAGYTDDAVLEPYEVQSEASMVSPDYQGTAVENSGGPDPGQGTEYVDVKEGTTAISLNFHPGTGGLQVLSAIGLPLDISAAFNSLAPGTGAALIPAAVSSVSAIP